MATRKKVSGIQAIASGDRLARVVPDLWLIPNEGLGAAGALVAG